MHGIAGKATRILDLQDEWGRTVIGEGDEGQPHCPNGVFTLMSRCQFHHAGYPVNICLDHVCWRLMMKS